MKKILLFLIVGASIFSSNSAFGVSTFGCVITCTVTSTPLTFCGGDMIIVDYSTSGTCNSTKSLYLSNSTGSFTGSVQIGTGNSSPITGIIPAGASAGSLYKVRVQQATIGTYNACNETFTINKPTILVSPSNSTICVGSNVNLVASGASTYEWDPATYLNSTVGSSVISSPTAMGTTDYTITGTDADGCAGVGYASVTADNNASLNVNAGADQTVCIGAPATLTATGADEYSWTPSDNLDSPTGSVVVATLATVGVYSFSVTGTSGSCPPATDEVIITVDNNVLVNAGADQTICAGEQASLMATGGGPDYTWSPADGLNTSTGANVISTTTVTITYTLATTGNCASEDEVTVTYAGAPPAIPGLGDDVAICEGSSTTLSVGYSADDNTYSWTPSLAGSLATMGTFVVLEAVAIENAELIVTATNVNSCSSSDTINIFVNANPVIAVSPSTNVNTTTGVGVTLTASNATSYTWSPATNLDASTGDLVEFTSSSAGTFTLIVVGTDDNGCEGSQEITITVTDPVIDDGVNDLGAVSPVSVYPNPYKTQTTIKFTTYSLSTVQLDVFNLLGQKVNTIANERISAGEHRYNFSAKQIGQPAGIYFIKLSVDGKSTMTRIVEME